ncbi:unnamed protein product [Rotaria sp. Silwood1]|nr:unnamed protein product [Rotaria sp. Silwood1]CAF1365386.1 unnamed protein product [Rotaria sp. Silwood1]CAF3599886.1 unnamed protein product [Rotaria sp. Silwood1]CAF3629772.1 unnamed protein product [Rotaria sp. Silwood1]
MSSLKINLCSICENELNETDDLVTTNSNYRCHRRCAQNSALGDALARLKFVNEGECSICESLWTSEDDLVITDCNHTFHYICAQDRLDKKGRTDCHFCHQDSALGNALSLKNLAKRGECSICENEWNWNDDIITTSCNHTFHRSCAQDRFDRRGRTDCHFCHQDSNLGIILSRNTPTTIKTFTEHNSNQIQSDKMAEMDTNIILVTRTESTLEKKESNWQCDECSCINEPSTKRCVFCGAPRFVLSSISTSLSQPQADATTKEDNQVTSSNRRPKNDKNKSLDPRIQGKPTKE